jgi:hypothetical protein
MVKTWIISAEQLNWSYDEWLDCYQPGPTRTYESSVLEAADESCLLQPQDLGRLLRAHGTTTKEYIQAHLDAFSEGLTILPLNHAGQVLSWLGY